MRPSRKRNSAWITLWTSRPLPENGYQACQSARPLASSATTLVHSTRMRVERAHSIRHMSPTSAPASAVNTGSEKLAPGA